MRQRQELRASLTRDLKSKSPSHAVRAVEELRHHGWLNDVLQEQKNGGLYMVVLEGADLRLVDLSDADLRGANLRRVNMFGSHLENADVRGANLQKAWLVNASLRGARLCYGHLEGAFLQDANLEGADLKDAKFEGATLPHAKLNGAINITEEQLLSVKLIGGATMPDGIMLSEGDLLVGVRQGIEGPSLEEWLARQRSLPANQRAIELSAIADVAPRLRKGSLGSREVFRVFARTVSSIFRRVLR